MGDRWLEPRASIEPLVSDARKVVIKLRAGEQRALEARAANPEQRVRALIVLACVAGKSNAAIARELGVSAHEVAKWRRAFVMARLRGLDEVTARAPRSESGHALLARWQRALADLEHDRTVLGLARPITTADLEGVAGRVAKCHIVPLVRGALDVPATLSLFEAAAAAPDPREYAAELDEFGNHDSVFPSEAADLLVHVEAAQRSRGHVASTTAGTVSPARRPLVVEQVTEAKVRRVPPGPNPDDEPADE